MNGKKRYLWRTLRNFSVCANLSLIEKTRYIIKHGDHLFEVDEFSGDNAGLIIAEVELKSEDEHFEKPAWLGKEVTGDSRYYNSSLSGNPYSGLEMIKKKRKVTIRYCLAILFVIAAIVIASLTIGRDIYYGSRDEGLLSFAIVNAAGYLFFLFMPVEIAFIYYLQGDINIIALNAVALGTALFSQVIDYSIGVLLSDKIIDTFIGRHRYEKAEDRLRKYGNIAIFVFNASASLLSCHLTGGRNAASPDPRCGNLYGCRIAAEISGADLDILIRPGVPHRVNGYFTPVRFSETSQSLSDISVLKSFDASLVCTGLPLRLPGPSGPMYSPPFRSGLVAA